MYKNAPLVEVIVEIRWAVIPLSAVPNGGVDPLFPSLEKSVFAYIASKGYRIAERVVPPQIPIEMLPHTAVHRYRMAANKYPLIQLGPGVLTCNVAPPYEGWDKFSAVIDTAIESIYPNSEMKAGTPEIKSVIVRYIDGFTSAHGMTSSYEFVRDHLKLSVGLETSILDKYSSKPADAKVGCQQTFSVLHPDRSTFSLNCASGVSNNKEAVVLDTSLQSPDGAEWKSVAEVKAWIKDAKVVLKQVFEDLISDKLREVMDPIPEKI